MSDKKLRMKDELYDIDQLACVSKGLCYLPPPPNLPHRIQTSYPQPYQNIFEKRESWSKSCSSR